MIQLSESWAKQLMRSPESGRDYHILTIVLKDGRSFDQVCVEGGIITKMRGHSELPFIEDDIQEIIVTHDKWDFRREY